MKGNKRERAHVGIFVVVSLVSLALVVFEFGDVSLDGRSAGLGRCFLGALVFLDLISSRWPLRKLFYCDGPASIWPRSLVAANKDPQIHPQDLVWPGVYMWSGSPHVVSTFMAIAGVASLMLCVGFYTHTAAFVCWIHLYSLSTRCSGITQAGDTLLRLLLFWIMWLPCELYFSVDAILFDPLSIQPEPGNTSATRIHSLAGAGILVQMSLLYLTPAAFKVDALWTAPTASRSAIYYVLANRSFCRENAITSTLLRNPNVLKLLTLTTPWLEHAAPLFIFGGNIRYLRAIGVMIFIGFHLGLHVTMTLGLFPWTCIAGWLVLVPAGYWGEGPVLSVASHSHGSIGDTSPVLRTITSMYHIFRLVLCSAAVLCSIHSCVDCLPGPHQVHLACDVRGPRRTSDSNEGTSTQKKVWKAYSWVYLGLGKLGRSLGVKQQWYLFDKPAASSYWYRVWGSVKAPKGADGSSGGNCAKQVYDLQKMLRMFVDGQLREIDAGEAKRGGKDTARTLMVSSERLTKNEGDISFENIYGGHRWRKFLQNIGKHPRETAAKNKGGGGGGRYKSFVDSYTSSLAYVWKASGMEREEGALSSVQCVGYWAPLTETRPSGAASEGGALRSGLLWEKEMTEDGAVSCEVDRGKYYCQ